MSPWQLQLLLALACVLVVALVMSFPMRHGPPAPPRASVNPAAGGAARAAGAPTDWRTPFESPRCVTQLRRDAAFTRAGRRTVGFYCKRRPVLYSPSQKLAYLKTPKAASIAIQELFQRQFPDYRWA